MSQLIFEAKQRIRQVRMKDVEVVVTHHGKPVPNAAVSLRMKNHQFLFGAVCYAHGKFGHPGKEERFTELFTKLFNYTMVPYHWSWYEPRRGEYNEPYTGDLVRWLNAPAGVVDDDLNPKPVYATLYDLIHRQWHTDADLTASSEGRCGTKVFCGTYEITAWSGGMKKTVTRDIHRESFCEGGGKQLICVDL